MSPGAEQPLTELARGMTAPQSVVQRCGLLLAKASLTAIPFTALVFDVGQLIVDIANAKVVDRYLDELGRRVDAMGEGIKQRLRDDPLHQIVGQGCLRSLLNESSERIAVALARGVAGLALLDAPFQERAECARILSAMSEPILHCLPTYHRFEVGCLSEAETAIEDTFPEDQRGNPRNHLGFLLLRSMPLLSWESVVETVMQLGLVAHHIDGGCVGELPEAVTVAPVTPLGHRILRLCFDDPRIPALGGFAAEPGST